MSYFEELNTDVASIDDRSTDKAANASMSELEVRLAVWIVERDVMASGMHRLRIGRKCDLESEGLDKCSMTHA